MRACLRAKKTYGLKVFEISNAFGVSRGWVLLVSLSEQWILLANIYFTRLFCIWLFNSKISYSHLSFDKGIFT